MENSAPQQQKVVRKIRKIKRPKTGFNPSVQQPQAPLKAGAPQAQEKPQSAPKIDFGVPEKQIVRNLPLFK